LNALKPLLSRLPNTHPIPTPSKLLLTLSSHEGSLQTSSPNLLYSKILSLAHTSLSKSLSLPPSESESASFGASISQWSAFPDTPSSLLWLQQPDGGNYKIVILSNVDDASFSQTQPKLGIIPDAVLTAEALGSYKPSLKNFRTMLEHVKKEWDVRKDEVLVVAQSVFHDHVPANELGLSNVWINRKGSTVGSEKGDVKIRWEFETLGEMVEEIKREKSS
jgi:2-haloalkanoic acid dehalogenase type II